MLEIDIVKPEPPQEGGFALLIGEEEPRQGLWAEIDRRTEGALSRAAEIAGFRGAKGQVVSLLAPPGGFSHLVVVGLGKAGEITPLAAAEAGGTAAAQLLRAERAALAAPGLSPELLAHALHGARLRTYRFDRYRTREKPEEKPKLSRLAALHAEPARVRAAHAPLAAREAGIVFTRDLVSEPANVLTPAAFAERCQTLAELGIKVEVMGPKELRKLGFGALLGVAQGSANEPRVVVLHWPGRQGKKKESRPLAFLGKGVTFDTGGISLKPAANMEDMKWDMAGAGAVAGLLAALARREAKAEVVGLLGLVENMPSGTAQRPGDVVRTYSGQTVEVINTDAEGRLVLADLLAWCQDVYKPRLMVDLATLTGAIIISLGHEHTGLFASDESLAAQLIAAGEATGETLWRMPLGEAYDRELKSDIADMKNVGGRPAGAITAAQFLKRFVADGVPWAHLDIAGTAWTSKDKPLVPTGASGFGVALLDHFIARNHEG